MLFRPDYVVSHPSGTTGKTVRLLASRLSTPAMFLDAIKSSPNMIVDLVDVAVNEPVTKNLPQSMCTSSCAGTIAVLMHIPFRETEEIDIETRKFSSSANTSERLNYLLSHESNWLLRVLNFLQPGVVDFFDKGMETISQYCTDARMKSLGFRRPAAQIRLRAIANLSKLGSGLFGLLNDVAAFEPAMYLYASRLLNTLHGTSSCLFRELRSTNQTQSSQTRLHYFRLQMTIQNVYDEKGNTIVVSVFPDVASACLIGLQRLIRHNRYTLAGTHPAYISFLHFAGFLRFFFLFRFRDGDYSPRRWCETVLLHDGEEDKGAWK
jgi:hypothetical protein